MQKARLRKRYLTRRQALSAAAHRQQSQQIQARFFQQFSLDAYPCIHTYLASTKHREVATWGIVDTIFSEHPEVVLAAPRLLDEPGQLESRQIGPKSSFRTHAWGMQEPSSGRRIAPEAFLLVILPVVAFDELGYRVGYGGGYYDRLLKQCRPAVTRVGLCFEDPVRAITDLNVHDVPMDYCVTPRQVFRWTHGAVPT